VYALEQNPEFSILARKIILRGVAEGAVLPTILVQEILAGYATQSEAQYEKAEQAIQALENVTFQSITLPIAKRAANLMRQYGKKVSGYDALHLASALETGAEVFYTNDKELVSIDAIHTLRIQSLA